MEGRESEVDRDERRGREVYGEEEIEIGVKIEEGRESASISRRGGRAVPTARRRLKSTPEVFRWRRRGSATTIRAGRLRTLRPDVVVLARVELGNEGPTSLILLRRTTFVHPPGSLSTNNCRRWRSRRLRAGQLSIPALLRARVDVHLRRSQIRNKLRRVLSDFRKAWIPNFSLDAFR